MNFLKIIIIFILLISKTNANTIYNLIKIPNLEIYKNNKNSILLCNMGKGCLIITDRSQIEFDSVKKISNKELMNMIQKKYLIDQTS